MKNLDEITNPVEWTRAVREQIYEETKNMTREERRERTIQASQRFEKRFAALRPCEPRPDWLGPIKERKVW